MPRDGKQHQERSSMSPQDVLKLCKQRTVQFIDLRFMDFPGLWQHTTCPISELTLDSFEHGFGFDGSSIRGWQAINESDMLLVPVSHTARIGWIKGGMD
jgi:glutamine synthetase